VSRPTTPHVPSTTIKAKGVLPTPDDVRRFDVFVVTLLLASDIDDVRLLLESVLVLFRFDKRDVVVFFRLLVSVLDAALKLSFKVKNPVV
jgi:hypothetical protein